MVRATSSHSDLESAPPEGKADTIDKSRAAPLEGVVVDELQKSDPEREIDLPIQNGRGTALTSDGNPVPQKKCTRNCICSCQAASTSCPWVDVPVDDDRSTPIAIEATSRTDYNYACHKPSEKAKSRFQSVKANAKTGIANVFGHQQGRRFVPPIYRKHKQITSSEKGPKASLFKILADECMEQYYDDNFEEKFGTVDVLAFGKLHHMNLHYFEVELAAELADVMDEKTATDRKQMLRIRKTLREYSAAIVDYERVLKLWQVPKEGKLTPFHQTILPKAFMKGLTRDPKTNPKADPKKGSKKVSKSDIQSSHTWDNAYMSLSSGNEWATSFTSRIGAAFLGGLALIAPMLIMSVHEATMKNLITTCVAVVLVSGLLAWFSTGPWNDVVGLTAAYAAVLVVYIGTSTPSSPSQA
ncbi:hypothetical protein BKA61DRAFT_680859 [Leptodontidium sp. MPI-SDFR-AT-0119]|nr:hypothetical protein BKA61DRAFT_680859 [Leptodontidium sp. MPI-SDFR-AT-0119]